MPKSLVPEHVLTRSQMPMPPDWEEPPQDEQPTPEGLTTATSRPIADPPWSAWDVLIIAFIFLVADVLVMFLAVMLAVRFAHMSLEQAAYNAWVVVPVQLVAYLAGFAYMYGLVSLSYRHRFWQTIRWVWPRGVVQRVGLIVIGVPLAFATTYLETVLPMPKEFPMEKFFRGPASAYLMAGLAIFAAPFIEELFFRGFLFPVARRWGVVFGVVFTSAAFALVHGTQYGWSASAVLLLLGVGLVLTITRARTGSVAPGFLIHVGYNLTLFTLLYFSTDHFRHLERAM